MPGKPTPEVSMPAKKSATRPTPPLSDLAVPADKVADVKGGIFNAYLTPPEITGEAKAPSTPSGPTRRG